MRRISGVILVVTILLVGCNGSNPSPTGTSTTGATTSGPTSTGATTAPTTPATTAPTTPATTGATTGGGGSDACAALDRLDADFKSAVPDYDEIKAAGEQAVQVSSTLSDQGQAALLATIGTDAQHSAQAFLDGDFGKGANLQNRVVATIGPAGVAFGCA